MMLERLVTVVAFLSICNDHRLTWQLDLISSDSRLDFKPFCESVFLAPCSLGGGSQLDSQSGWKFSPVSKMPKHFSSSLAFLVH